MCLLAFSPGAWAQTTATLTFEKACGATKNGSIYTATATDNENNTWTITSDGQESNFDDTKGIHFGTSNEAVKYISLSTSGIKGTISKIVINASTAARVTGATVSATVGGSAFGGASQPVSTTAKEYTFEGSASGDIVVTLSKTSSANRALYVKSISVTYTDGATKQAVNVTFPQTSYTAKVGETFTAPQPTITPADVAASSLTYSSSNTSVATVNASTGAVTIVATGTTTITASYAGDDTHASATASYTLTVSRPAEKQNVTMSFDGTTYVLDKKGAATGASITNTPTLTINPSGLPVTYTSSNPDVATVNNTGALTIGAKTGTTTITATFAGDDNYNPATASYTLKIYDTSWTSTPTGNYYQSAEYIYIIDWDKDITSTLPVAIISPDNYNEGDLKDETGNSITGYVGLYNPSSSSSTPYVYTAGYTSTGSSTTSTPTELTDYNILSYLKFRTIKDTKGQVWEPVVHVSAQLNSQGSGYSTSNPYKRISIRYVTNPIGSPLQYSKQYYASATDYNSGTLTKLGNNDVSASLYMDATKEVQDTISSQIYGELRYYDSYSTDSTDYTKYQSYNFAPTDGVDFYGSVSYEALLNSNDNNTQYFTDDNTSRTGGGSNYNRLYAKYGYFRRTHTVPVSTAKSVTVPASVSIDGATYKVTTIGYKDMTSRLWNITFVRDLCRAGSKTPSNITNVGKSKQWVTWISHNRTLKNVYFSTSSNLTTISEYAFSGCEDLSSIVIPNTVETIGDGTFFLNYLLRSVQYQTKTRSDGYVGCNDNLTKINDDTFYGCTHLTSLEIPYGITSVGDYALTYNFMLSSIVIPNSMKTLGAHFLCCASSLKSLTIPASVTSINGAFLHGCESLTDVYLLGTASALDEKDVNGNNTFGYNSYFCKGHVQKCTFHVPSDYYDSYAKDKVWSLIDEQGLSDGNTYTNSGGNSVTRTYANTLEKIQNEVMQFFPTKWQTVIFPSRIKQSTDDNLYTGFGSNYYDTSDGNKIKFVPLNYFGDGTLVATLTKVDVDNNDPHLYHLTFGLIRGLYNGMTYHKNASGTSDVDESDWNKIPVNSVLLIKPAKEVSWTMFTDADQEREDFKAAATSTHDLSVTAEDGAVITMRGQFVPYKTTPWDFYMKTTETNADGTKSYSYGFRKVIDAAKAATVKATRCWWRIDASGIKTDPDVAGAKPYFSTDDGVSTDIENIIDSAKDDTKARFVIDGIYDLNGRRIDGDFDSLEKGVYIVNGKKVLKK